jgi:DNA-directed RNA polymerase specialized sigma24 family protein
LFSELSNFAGLERRFDERKLDMLSHKGNGATGRALEYATAEDFCRIFHEDMSGLYWFALVLTADETKAEQCFVAGFEECIQGNSVFKDWARSWSRRVVIKNAIRRATPVPGAPNGPSTTSVGEPVSDADTSLPALRSLRPFERFIFVMSVLEGYADRDCATLLGCSSTQVAKARARALLQLRRAFVASGTLPVLRGADSQDAGLWRNADVA